MGSIFQGERVRLRAFEPDDWQFFHTWDQDTDDAQLSYEIPVPRSVAAAQQWARDQSLARPEGDAYRFLIENRDGEQAGTINTFHCDLRNGTFSYGLAIHPAMRRKGYASEAVQLLLGYYFDERRYQKVTVVVYSFNTASIALHERLGFQREGQLRRMVYTNGQYHDHLIYGMTARERAHE